MRGNDELFREIAEKYTEQYGQTLRDESIELNRQTDAVPSTANLERRVRRKIAAEKRKPYRRIITTIAACLAIALLLPFALRNGLTPPDSDASTESPQTSSGITEPSDSSQTQPDTTEPTETPPEDFAVIPLSASLPPEFTNSGFVQDNGKSVYYIDDVYKDNVVVTLEKAALPDTSGLTVITLGDTVAYGTQTDSYSLLTFQNGGVIYELTCQYDINTLLKLGEAFV